jgi:hypothetical protein
MSIRWDLKPVFKNADEDSEAALWTRRSLITGIVALIGFGFVTWNMGILQMLMVGVVMIAAFDCGDHRFPYDDDEDEIKEDGTIVTPHDKMYRP